MGLEREEFPQDSHDGVSINGEGREQRDLKSGILCKRAGPGWVRVDFLRAPGGVGVAPKTDVAWQLLRRRRSHLACQD